ncbi:methylated-DNA--[protein]-cysteine S-methyltransferase [Sanguibacter antarcticus]|uniref:Methylated-DNA--protein-cysteine methyltransferase n=1 Tax=Sanguibacter antarcticus TaxID=372484 RepID=A0A2A9E305_9MICO|nr:methylated-DNA--[protein]-cysteine S-methyltransferase [Sanguibacter antarcticus]PFG32602.1 methylated-DNA-[protein]-cysteine S-methyltransferase [Sanguibacter antarcticus]
MTNDSLPTFPDATASSLLETLGAADDDASTRLAARLAAAAADEDLLDIAYRTLDTPVGQLVLAATTEGLVRVAFASEGLEAVLSTLALRISPRVLYAPARLDATATELDEYFAGRRRTFDVPLDLRLAVGFRRDVVTALPTIAYGSTASYAAVAARAGSPRATRAVGTACARNPLPLVLPCHRVVRTDGGLGQYAGGAATKAWLLDLERGR